MALSPGTRLGPYEIAAPLGSGGMGEVYKARDPRLNRYVAIKVLRSERIAEEARRQRFLQEAQAVSALNHPNIVAIYDIAVESGETCLVMEFVPGKTIDALIPRTGMRLSEILKIAIPAAAGFAAAHAAGILHRDIKPANLIVSETGQVKILDFGLAKLIEPGRTDGNDSTVTIGPETGDGIVLGTAPYMSPEQAEGKPLHPTSDIFSFGAVLYEMAAGRRAFPGASTAASMAAVLHHEPEPLSKTAPGLPQPFEQLVMRCLRKDPDRRMQNMADIKVLLEELKEDSESDRLAAASRSSRPRRWTLGGVAALTLAAAAGGLWIARRSDEPPPRIVPLTASAGNESFASFSPDGSQVVFAWDGENQQSRDLYVKMIGSATALRLTTDGASNLFPAWSPDGRQIAFLKGGPRPGIYLISPLGGPEQKLDSFEGAGTPAWSPDGRFLIVAKPSRQPATEVDEGALFRFRTEGGEPRRILRPEPGRFYRSAAIAPNGRQLAFASCASSGSPCGLSLIELGADSLPRGSPRRIADVAAAVNGLAWMPDGRSMIYAAGNSLNDEAIWRLAASGGPPKALEISPQGAMSPAVALKGNRLAFTRFANDFDVWRIRPGGGPQPFLVSSAVDTSPQFSPDGRRIAFTSGRGIDRVSIWLCDADGAHLAQLSRGPGTYDGSARWSPDGRKIAFDALGSDGFRNVMIVDSDGGQPRALTGGAFNSKVPAWSADGRWVYFTSDRTGRYEIWRGSAQGGTPEQITRNGGYVALESPDGKILYYTKTGAYSGARLYALGLPGGGEEREVLSDIAGRGFVVLQDGIYYLTTTGAQTTDIRFYDFATRRDSVVANVQGSLGLGLSVSPDRKTILFARWVTSGTDLMLIENFR